ncbi:hypothetical protein [uncultured Roseobacter sp.]|uniref:hypothetical protein n=1 Tax=uncultured Roseobacter sp. TaxID=114847 RepID=UPI00262A80C0|nr:hypothetical protein [uncultured Roseobacter sp.]
MRFITLTTALITFAAADTARAGADTPVAEIVTFRLVEGADQAAFAEAASGMTPYLEGTGAIISRTLSADETGLWTDHITWTSMHAAKEAAAAMMQQPEAGPFMSLIDPDSVIMRHAPIRFSLKME